MKCSKVSFSKGKAHTAQKTIQIKGKQMRSYKCPECFKYHLTSDLNGARVFKTEKLIKGKKIDIINT